VRYGGPASLSKKLQSQGEWEKGGAKEKETLGEGNLGSDALSMALEGYKKLF
jgi:hypothetical protein